MLRLAAPLPALRAQGDQRKNVSAFLIGNELCKKDTIKVHGF